MNKLYGIVFDYTQDKKQIEKFTEIIRSTFVSKKGNENIFLVSVAASINAKEIHNMIAEKMSSPDFAFFVCSMENFYGTMPEESFTWVRETFAGLKLYSDMNSSVEKT